MPAGAEAYVLKGVLHDWEDAEALAILRNVRAAMGAGARLLVIERILPERIDPSDVLTPGRFIHDINMMLNPGGRERTEAEFCDLLARAGLRLMQIVPTPSPLSVKEAASPNRRLHINQVCPRGLETALGCTVRDSFARLRPQSRFRDRLCSRSSPGALTFVSLT